MRLAQEGDQVAYASLLVQLTSATRQFANRRVGAVPWVDDIVQETLLTVHNARQTYDARRPFAPWFYAIAFNRMVDVIRRERRVGSREIGADELPEQGTAGPRPAHQDVDTEAVRAALAALPARQRDIIESLKFRDQSVREISARTGMSESAVKVAAHRGYRILKRVLLGGKHED